MFLNVFNHEEKEKFLELVYKVANCDGNYAKDEKELVESYKIELGLSEIPETASIDDLIQYFAEKPEQIQKIVWFELYGMIISDDTFTDEEVKITNLIKDKFSISSEMIQNIQDVALELQKVYDKVYDCIF